MGVLQASAPAGSISGGLDGDAAAVLVQSVLRDRQLCYATSCARPVKVFHTQVRRVRQG